MHVFLLFFLYEHVTNKNGRRRKKEDTEREREKTDGRDEKIVNGEKTMIFDVTFLHLFVLRFSFK